MYFLALLQTSFLPHFFVGILVPNSIFIVVVLVALFEKKGFFVSTSTSLVGGFFLDVFSLHMFGYWIAILLVAAFFTRVFLRKYVQLPFIQQV